VERREAGTCRKDIMECVSFSIVKLNNVKKKGKVIPLTVCGGP
jgi:hypothetical protein